MFAPVLSGVASNGVAAFESLAAVLIVPIVPSPFVVVVSPSGASGGAVVSPPVSAGGDVSSVPVSLGPGATVSSPPHPTPTFATSIAAIAIIGPPRRKQPVLASVLTSPPSFTAQLRNFAMFRSGLRASARVGSRRRRSIWARTTFRVRDPHDRGAPDRRRGLKPGGSVKRSGDLTHG